MPIDAQLDAARTGEFPGDLIPRTEHLGYRRVTVLGRGWHVSMQIFVGPGHAASSSPPAPSTPEQWEIGLIQQRVSFSLTAEWEDGDGNTDVFRYRDPRRRPDVARSAPPEDIWAPAWPPPGGVHPPFVPFTYDANDTEEQRFGVEMTDGPSDPWLYYRDNVPGSYELRSLAQSYTFRIYLVARRVGTTRLHVIKVFDPFEYSYVLRIPSSPWGGGGHPVVTSPPPISLRTADRGGGRPVVTGPRVYEVDDPILAEAGLL